MKGVKRPRNHFNATLSNMRVSRNSWREKCKRLKRENELLRLRVEAQVNLIEKLKDEKTNLIEKLKDEKTKAIIQESKVLGWEAFREKDLAVPLE